MNNPSHVARMQHSAELTHPGRLCQSRGPSRLQAPGGICKPAFPRPSLDAICRSSSLHGHVDPELPVPPASAAPHWLDCCSRSRRVIQPTHLTEYGRRRTDPRDPLLEVAG